MPPSLGGSCSVGSATLSTVLPTMTMTSDAHSTASVFQRRCVDGLVDAVEVGRSATVRYGIVSLLHLSRSLHPSSQFVVVIGDVSLHYRSMRVAER